MCHHCRRVHKSLAIFHKHPCPLLHSSLLTQQECPSSLSDQWHSVGGHRILIFRCHHSLTLGAYNCTTVMLKGTALGRMVMSLLETWQHPMTMFTMSLWTRNPMPCPCLSSFPLQKTLYPSSVVVSLKFYHPISQSPRKFHLYLSTSCVSSWSFPAAPSVLVFHVPIMMLSFPWIFDDASVTYLTSPSWCTAEGALLVDLDGVRSSMVWLLVFITWWVEGKVQPDKAHPSPGRTHGR